MRRFENKIVFVTGAASGIGLATVLRLADEGATIICTDIQEEKINEAAKQCEERGAETLPMVLDVSDPDAAKSAIQSAIDRFGRLDALLNIAGILRFEHTHEITLENWNHILNVNLTGTFLMCREALPYLLESKGNIVNMSSNAALAGHPWTAAYSASKGGILAFTYTLAVEYGKQGLRANAVCPGAIKTPIFNAFNLPEGADGKLVYRILPILKDGVPEDGAASICFLASDDAAHINGIALRVDGGTLS